MAETANLSITLMEVGQSGKEATFNAAMAIIDAALPGGGLSTPIAVDEGGTGAASLTDHGVLVGSGTDPITALSVGATGTVLAGSTGADPSFSASPSLSTSLTVPIVYGSASSAGDLTLHSTSHGTKGKIFFGSASVYDQVNNFFGFGELTPLTVLHIADAVTQISSTHQTLRVNATHTLGANNSNIWESISLIDVLNQNGFNATAGGGGMRGVNINVSSSGASGTVSALVGYNSTINNTGAGTLSLGISYFASAPGNSGGGTYAEYDGFRQAAVTAPGTVHAFRGLVAAASGRWNVYCDGTAQNYFAGNVGIGSGATVPGVLLDLGFAGTTKGVLRFAGNTSGNVTVQPAATAGTWTLTLPSDDGNATDTLYTDGSGVTSWLPTTLVETFADATSVTPALGATGRRYLGKQTNTQAGGTLTVNAPTGTPSDGQIVMLRFKLTNAQTMSFNAVYRGSTDLALPASLGAGATHYLCFQYNSTDSKYDYLAENKGF